MGLDTTPASLRTLSAALALALLALGVAGQALPPAEAGAGVQPGILLARLWLWRAAYGGSVLSLALGDGALYALVNASGAPLVVSLNATSGKVLWMHRLPGRPGPGGLAVAGRVVYVALAGPGGANSTSVSLYAVSGARHELLYTVNLTSPLYLVLAAQPLPSGEVAVAGARYRLGRGYQYYLALAMNGRILWEHYWGGAGDEYLNTISVGPDMSVCAAGPVGGVACYSYDGKTLLNATAPFKPLALAALGGGRVLVAGVNGSKGVIGLLGPHGVQWIKSTGAFVPTALSPMDGGAAVAGVIAPPPYLLGLLILDLNGSARILGYTNETHTSLLPVAAAAERSVAYVGGEMGGRPFIGAIIALQQPQRPTATAGSGGHSRLILVEEIALAIAAATLAATLAIVKPWRWRARSRA